MRHLLHTAVFLVILTASSYADALPLPSSGNGYPSEDPTNFDDYQTWELTDWDAVDPLVYDAPSNANSGITATTQGDYQNALKFAILEAFQATMGMHQELMVNALMIAGTKHHGNFDNSILVPGAYSPDQADASQVHGLSALSTSQIPNQDHSAFSKLEKEIKPDGGDYDTGIFGTLKTKASLAATATVPQINRASLLSTGKVTGHNFGTVGVWQFNVAFGQLGNIVVTMRLIMLIAMTVVFCYQASQIPRKYV